MSNHAWRVDTKYGVAYIEDHKLVSEVLRLDGSKCRERDAVMATYLSPQGKPFAWQVRFHMDNWERISRALGLEAYEKKPACPAGKRKAAVTRRGRTAGSVRAREVSRPGRK